MIFSHFTRCVIIVLWHAKLLYDTHLSHEIFYNFVVYAIFHYIHQERYITVHNKHIFIYQE